MKKTFLLHPVFILGCLLAAACSVIDYHPYDARVEGPENRNAAAAARIEGLMRGRSTLRFAVISDTQRWYDETAACIRSINARGDVDFVIHLGDLTDFGATKEFEWMDRELGRLAVPMVVLLGNHDCLATGVDVWRRTYGAANFSFTAGDTRFVCLNTNALEYDYGEPVPDFSYIGADVDATCADGAVRRTVVCMHAAPGSEQFNNNAADYFQYLVRRYPGLQFCLHGHDHHTGSSEPFGDGVVYWQCGSAGNRNYLVFTLDEEGGYDCQTVDF